jgi:hypothetical protein
VFFTSSIGQHHDERKFLADERASVVLGAPLELTVSRRPPPPAHSSSATSSQEPSSEPPLPSAAVKACTAAQLAGPGYWEAADRTALCGGNDGVGTSHEGECWVLDRPVKVGAALSLDIIIS